MIQICKYGHPILRAKATPVVSVDRDLGKLADAMLEFMMEKNGVGLAAQQVGRTIRVFVMYVAPQYDVAVRNPPGAGGIAGREMSAGPRLNPEINEPLVMINPVILARQGAQSDKEGCLSIPEIFAPVRRSYEVSVSFLDARGRPKEIKARGLMARVIQHELDHLDGILFVDRVSALKKISLAAALKRLKRATESDLRSG